MTAGTEMLTRDLEAALLLAALLLDPPPGREGWRDAGLRLIDGLRPALGFRSALAQELLFAVDDFRLARVDPETPAPLRAWRARHDLATRLHSICARHLVAAIERIEARGIAVRAPAVVGPEAGRVAEGAA
jgi:hypothetical protein